MKKIGLDISFDVCRGEGYMTMEYSPRDFKKSPTLTECTFQKTLNDFDREYLGWQFNGYDTTILDQCYSYNELHEVYTEQSSADDDEFPYTEFPSPIDVLHLANAVNELGYLDTVGITLNQLKWVNEEKEKQWKLKKAKNGKLLLT